uniref:Secreted protein n=1 Tax=Strigamia maritima TaxID=126957 RepID=T1IW97_STRMM
MCKAQFVFCLLVVISYAFAASLESVSGSSAQHDDGNTGLPLENLTEPQLKITPFLHLQSSHDSSTKKSLNTGIQNDEADDNDEEENAPDESDEEDEDDDDDYDESRPKSKNIDEDASYDSTYDDADK